MVDFVHTNCAFLRASFSDPMLRKKRRPEREGKRERGKRKAGERGGKRKA
jgi:hypothetical protein